eukprot:SAG31_NODE_49861_length_127_cov_40.392857_1_plen_35_part_10
MSLCSGNTFQGDYHGEFGCGTSSWDQTWHDAPGPV